MLEFAHGGGVVSFANEIGCSVDEVIDLSSNINFIKPTVKLDFNSLNISSYPTYENLYEIIAKNYKVGVNNIELFNGGSSAIFSLFRYLKQTGLNHCTIYSPAYLEYKKASQTFDYELDRINRLEYMGRFVKEGSFVIFVNPSTPDGLLYDIDEYMSYWVSKYCTILVDESFLDFNDGKSVIPWLEKYDKLYILKSMTKFYSSAGIRVGTLVSNERNIYNIKKYEPMWKISEFDMNYLISALKDTTFPQISRSINIKNSLQLKKVLKEFDFIEEISDSKANYYLCKLKDMRASTLQEKLKPFKIMIRDCSNFDYLDESHIRIAVKSQSDIKALRKALKSIS